MGGEGGGRKGGKGNRHKPLIRKTSPEPARRRPQRRLAAPHCYSLPAPMNIPNIRQSIASFVSPFFGLQLTGTDRQTDTHTHTHTHTGAISCLSICKTSRGKHRPRRAHLQSNNEKTAAHLYICARVCVCVCVCVPVRVSISLVSSSCLHPFKIMNQPSF